jgi:hypothetical protein
MAEPVSLKYRAFISYSHADTSWAKWLHRALESFTIDKDLVGRETATGPTPKALRPIFRDRDDFTAARQALTIADRLAKVDPGNAGWQRDLSVSYNKVGDVLVAQGNLAAALVLEAGGGLRRIGPPTAGGIARTACAIGKGQTLPIASGGRPKI